MPEYQPYPRNERAKASSSFTTLDRRVYSIRIDVPIDPAELKQIVSNDIAFAATLDPLHIRLSNIVGVRNVSYYMPALKNQYALQFTVTPEANEDQRFWLEVERVVDEYLALRRGLGE